METLEKVVRLGEMKLYQRPVSVYCKIAIEDGRLSITGVEGPKANGDCVGSCGQISMHPINISDPAPGWDKEKIARFFEVWHNWHLNDMRAGCQHQRAKWNTTEEITIYHFRLCREVEQARRDTETRAKASIAKGEIFTPTADESRLAKLADRLTWDAATLPTDLAEYYTPNGPQYSGDQYNRSSETKLVNWVRPDEHPKGILCKPCEVCGYKYGSQWLSEALPADVVDFLKSLPDTDKTPAWV